VLAYFLAINLRIHDIIFISFIQIQGGMLWIKVNGS
jgi:hypothetical protein